MADGGSGGPTSKTSILISSATDKNRSSFTSRSFFTQALRSSSSPGCGFDDVEGEKKFGPDSGMGIGTVPSQWPHVPFAVNTALTPRRHLAY